MDGFDLLYPKLVRRAWEHGAHRTARGKPHRALFNVLIETRAEDNLLVGLPKKFAIAELMAYVAGWDDVAWLQRFNKNIAQFSDDGVSFAGAYGPRIEASMGSILLLLHDDPETRQAFLPIYWPSDLVGESKDKPCNTSFQLQVWGGQLHMTIYQRSCDLVWGLPFDHFSFSTVTSLLAHQVGLKPGSVTRLIGNAHVYEPSAGYSDMARLMKAMEMNQTEQWMPAQRKYLEFRDTALQARYIMEASGKVNDMSQEAIDLAFYLEGTKQ